MNKIAETVCWISPIVAVGIWTLPSKSTPLYFVLAAAVAVGVLVGAQNQNRNPESHVRTTLAPAGILPVVILLFAPLNILVANYSELSATELSLTVLFTVVFPLLVMIFLYRASAKEPWRLWLLASLVFTVLIGPAFRETLAWPNGTIVLVLLLMGVLFYLFLRSVSSSKIAGWTIGALLAASLSYDFVSSPSSIEAPEVESLQASIDSYLAGSDYNDIRVDPSGLPPSVSILTYDAYPNSELASGLGISTQENMDFLVGQGFTVYPGVISSGSNSLASMGRVFNASHASLPTVTSRYVVSGGGAVFRAFQDAGYRTVGIHPSSYFYPNDKGFSDLSWPLEGDRDSWNFLRTLLGGEIRYNGYWHAPREDFLAQKRSILAATHQVPTLVYSHDSFPGHTQNSGKCLDEDSLESWEPRLRLAEEEMAKDLQSFVNLDDQIIVLMSDHGPYLTQNCFHLREFPSTDVHRLDIQDRYGAFLAIRWPPHLKERGENLQIGTIQDLFPAISYVLSGATHEDSFASLPRDIDGAVLPPGVTVKDGVIDGGVDDGKPVFESFSWPENSVAD